MNTIEFFIHVEDVLRAQPGWEPRPLSNAMADALWKRTGPGGMAKKVAGTVVLEAPGRDRKESGTGPRVVVAGDPGELMLFSAGRQRATSVEITGDETLVAQLRSAALGI
jgi:uncharacterized protein (TIGR03085 family)